MLQVKVQDETYQILLYCDHCQIPIDGEEESKNAFTVWRLPCDGRDGQTAPLAFLHWECVQSYTAARKIPEHLWHGDKVQEMYKRSPCYLIDPDAITDTTSL